jgi:hypothetical protein
MYKESLVDGAWICILCGEAIYPCPKDIGEHSNKHRTEKDREIAEFDKALSGFRMWLSAKNRESVLLDPDEVKEELEARIKESKETKRQEDNRQ